MQTKKPRKFPDINSIKANQVDIGASQVEILPSITPFEYPILFHAKDKYTLFSEWLKSNKPMVQDYLHRYGAILFRNFNMDIANSFREVVNAYGNEVMEYTLGAARRTKVVDNIYLSTHHPAAEDLEMHNEMSYASDWPIQILLYCDAPSPTGGETPLCDGRRLWEMLKPETRARFEEKQVMYVRRLGGIFGGLTWQKVFQTEDRAVAEQKCRESNMTYEWLDGDVLVMRWVKPATMRHPATGDVAWFNHAFFFNSIMLNPEIRTTLKVEDMPFYSYYGDGTEIEEEVLEELSVAFKATKSAFRWEKGDMLLVDNILLSHGRNAYTGDRKVLVAMFKSLN